LAAGRAFCDSFAALDSRGRPDLQRGANLGYAIKNAKPNSTKTVFETDVAPTAGGDHAPPSAIVEHRFHQRYGVINIRLRPSVPLAERKLPVLDWNHQVLYQQGFSLVM
jgi:hypothetical protein